MQNRRGNSILEVLWAILIASIGLLGAIAVFPLATTQARRGLMNEIMATAGRSSFHSFDAMGMRRPDRWMVWDRYLASAMETPQLRVGIDPILGQPAGTAYCIDPRFVATNVASGNATYLQASYFPYYYPASTTPTASVALDLRMARITLCTPTANPPLVDPRITRLTLGGKSYDSLHPLVAESIFMLGDDVAYFRPGVDKLPDYLATAAARNDKSLPAIQNYAIEPINSTKTARQSRSEFSWMATLVPKMDLYAGTASDQYVLSIVMFYQRPADLTLSVDHERVLNVDVYDGVTGGEVRLYAGATNQYRPPTQEDADRYLKLKPNDWVLLCGCYGAVAGGPCAFQWYRVSDCDSDVIYNGTDYEIHATLMGQDWNPANFAAGSQRAVIVEGVIGVFEKTVRLEYGEAL